MLRILSAFVLVTASGPLFADDARPNIVIILCDDMGFSDIGCYGGEMDTPHLDALAESGLRFTDFHNDAKCSQTRASLLTGLWHQQSKNLKTPNHVTLAEVLGRAGYHTMMSGKWHLARTPPARGFDRFFGFLGGAINYFTGSDWQSGKNRMRLDEQVYEAPDGFYSTDAITDYAIRFLDEIRDSERPFFLYLAHNAPHFPLHAWPEDIAKYRGRYDAGWDVIRQRRYQRLRKLGIVDHSWRLSPRDPKVEPWVALSDEQAEFLLPMMVVYAAMVDRLDQNIGRLVDYLRERGELDNTLILFMSDNGACPYQRLRTPGVPPGPKHSDIAYDARWANMCNTPLRLYKQYAHEGGTTTPMIAHWPARIKAQGEISRFTGHLVDIMPTVVELAGADYPKRFNQYDVLPMEGVSMVSALIDGTASDRIPIYWDFNGNHAIRDGRWKLVAERAKDWELYDLSGDRSETNDLAGEYPDQVRRLADKYDAWARRVGARSHAKARSLKPSQQSQLFDLP